MCSFSDEAGERPIVNPPASLAPIAAHIGKPVVAPFTKTALFFATQRPNSFAFSSASGAQCPVSAAPDTQILCLKCMCFPSIDFSIPKMFKNKKRPKNKRASKNSDILLSSKLVKYQINQL